MPSLPGRAAPLPGLGPGHPDPEGLTGPGAGAGTPKPLPGAAEKVGAHGRGAPLPAPPGARETRSLSPPAARRPAASPRFSPPHSAAKAGGGDQGGEEVPTGRRRFLVGWGETGRCPFEAVGGGTPCRTWPASKAPHPLSDRFSPSAVPRTRILLVLQVRGRPSWVPAPGQGLSALPVQGGRPPTNIPAPENVLNPGPRCAEEEILFCRENAALELGLQKLPLRAGING